MRDEGEWILMGEKLGEEVGGMEERKTLLILYCMCKESMFNKRKINLKLLLRIKQSKTITLISCFVMLEEALDFAFLTSSPLVSVLFISRPCLSSKYLFMNIHFHITKESV